ncbi:hypothetical protein B4U80_13445 [Leptotrombidium deliense]|uniref:ATP-dependent RNA helicase n=1 Tax=Leptotrombidium deliense TaxID=299467 RepID=A0A443S6B0_9ACAR|nr:hypothetical protein B4U80_13445 [Leptotrombidium deliense]
MAGIDEFGNNERGLNSEETDWNELIDDLTELGLNETLVDSLYVIRSNEQSASQVRAMLTSKSRNDFVIRSTDAAENANTLTMATLNRVNNEVSKCQAVILTGTHFEAQQILDTITPICMLMKLNACICSKATNIRDDMDAMQQQQDVHIVIGTPGRIFDLLSIDSFHFDTINVIVFFEMENILHNGYQKYCYHFSEIISEYVNVYVSTKYMSTSNLSYFKRTFIEMGDRYIETTVIASEITRSEEVVDMFCRINVDSVQTHELEIDSSLTLKSQKANGDFVIDASIETDFKSASSFDYSLCHSSRQSESSVKYIERYGTVRIPNDQVRFHLLKPVMEGFDELISSLPPSKTSKYVAMSAIHRVNPALNYCQVVIVAASRRRSKELLNVVNRYTYNIRTALAIGGKEFHEDDHRMIAGAQIIIGTPGRLMRLVSRLSRGKGIKLLIFDGIEYMLGYDINKDKLFFLLTAVPLNVQFLFTTSKVTTKTLEFTQKVFTKKSNGSFQEQMYVVIKNEDWKFDVICNILRSFNMQTIIACNTRDTVNLVASVLRDRGFAGFKIHEEMPIAQRSAILDNFRCGFNRVLISTHFSTQTLRDTRIPLLINYDNAILRRSMQTNDLHLYGPPASINFVTY